MTSKREHDTYQKRKHLENHDVDANPYGGIKLHNSNESAKHLVVKALVCLELSRAGREWQTEVTLNSDGDRADIIDYGGLGEDPVCIEIESDPSPARTRDKLDRYLNAGLRDVIVLDLTEAPDTITELTEFIQTELGV